MHNLFRKLFSKRKRGFTLVEILIVLVILAILTAVAIPTYKKVINRSRVSDGMHVLDMLAEAQEKYFIEHGHYASGLSLLNVPIRSLQPHVYGPDYIFTKNFRYEQKQNTTCIEAVAQNSGNYKLVKNYGSNAKVVCINGEEVEDCQEFATASGVVVSNDLGAVCPVMEGSTSCNQSQADCPTQYFDPINCCTNCSRSAYEDCVQHGGTFLPFDGCRCNTSGNLSCSIEGATTNKIYDPNGATCNYYGEHPEYGTGAKISDNDTNADDNTHEWQRPKCGIVTYFNKCVGGVWTSVTGCDSRVPYCRSKYGADYSPNPDHNCACEQAISCGPMPNTCDPCPAGSVTNVGITQQWHLMYDDTVSTEGFCFHCGTPADGATPHCENGQWVFDPGDCNPTPAPDTVNLFDGDCDGRDIY